MSMEHWWNDTDRGKVKYIPQWHCFTTIVTWTELGSNSSLRGKKSASDRMSHGTVHVEYQHLHLRRRRRCYPRHHSPAKSLHGYVPIFNSSQMHFDLRSLARLTVPVNQHVLSRMYRKHYPAPAWHHTARKYKVIRPFSWGLGSKPPPPTLKAEVRESLTALAPTKKDFYIF
jgi:hypothetical protein